MTKTSDPSQHNTFLVQPDIHDARLSTPLTGINESGQKVDLKVVTERAITIYLNTQEIVTVMTIGDHPDLLAIGFLFNQAMLTHNDVITGVDYDDDLGVVIVRTKNSTQHEAKQQKRVRTSGCAQGTLFGGVMESFDTIKLGQNAFLKTSWLYALTKKINTAPSLYLEAGAIHGCVLCEEDRPLAFMEDVGRHNAVDKIAGWMAQNNVRADNKIFYTTGRLTSEMVIKTVMMGVPILVSRSGFTAWGVELAQKAGLTLIGRARGKRFVVLSGADRIIFDADVTTAEDETRKHKRKSADD